MDGVTLHSLLFPAPKPKNEGTVPDVVGKSKEQRIEEAYGTAADKRRGERLISPYSGVPASYEKSRAQINKEALEEAAEDKNR